MQGRHLLAAALALVLVMAACGDDDVGTTTTGAPGATTTTTEATGATETTAAINPTTTAAEAGPEEPCVMWYTDFSAGTLTKYDVCAAECLGTTEVGTSAQFVDVAFGSVWVTDCKSSQLVRVDVETNEVTGRINIPGCPSDFLLAQEAIWLTLPDLPGLWEIDPATGEVISEIITYDSPSSMGIGSLWVGFYNSWLAWTGGDIHAVGMTTLEALGFHSADVVGSVGDFDGDPLFTAVNWPEDGGDADSTLIGSVDTTGTVTTLADLPGWYKKVIRVDNYFVAIGPYVNNVYVGMTDGPGHYEIPVTAPYAMRKPRNRVPALPGGGPPGVRPPNPNPGGGPPPLVVIGNKQCDLFQWPNGSHDSLTPLGNCACSWTEDNQLTDLTIASYDRVTAEAEYATGLPGGFPNEEAIPRGMAAGPRCTSQGYASSNGGRTIDGINSTWVTEDGAAAVGLEVMLFLTTEDGWLHSGSVATTDANGEVSFDDAFNFDDIPGAPEAGSEVTLGQSPKIDGAFTMGICEIPIDI